MRQPSNGFTIKTKSKELQSKDDVINKGFEADHDK